MLRVVIADDQDLFLGGFAMVVGAQPDMTVVAEAADGALAIAAAIELRPDIVLMDVRMPNVDGIAATRRICAETDAKVIVMTMFDDDEYVYAAIEAGASAFLLKEMHRDDLAKAIRLVAAGDALLAPSVTRRVIAKLARRGRSVPKMAQQLRDLTERERDVLLMLARGMSNVEISASMQLSENTVKTHVSNLLGKLALRDRAQAVVFAYESGLVLAGES